MPNEMPKLKASQLTLVEMLVFLTGTCIVASLAVVGGRPWFVLGSIILASFCFLRIGFRWARHGAGYWPSGVFGTISAFVLPLAMVALVHIVLWMIGKQRFWRVDF
jgi:hypothetical protein